MKEIHRNTNGTYHVHEPGRIDKHMAMNVPTLETARLIAAAPELLSALEKVTGILEQWVQDEYSSTLAEKNPELAKELAALIAKAKGE